MELIKDEDLQRDIVRYYEIFQPYFYSRRLMHTEELGVFNKALEMDFSSVPDLDYSTHRTYRRELKVSPNVFPSHPDFMDLLIKTDTAAKKMQNHITAFPCLLAHCNEFVGGALEPGRHHDSVIVPNGSEAIPKTSIAPHRPVHQ